MRRVGGRCAWMWAKELRTEGGFMSSPKSSARANYNRLSRWYDLLAGRAEREHRQRALDMLAAQPGERVLEVGFGTGDCLISLARAVGPEGEVCGVDIAERMVAVARAKIDAAGLPKRPTLVCADGARLPLADDAMDCVLMTFALELHADAQIPIVLQECRRVLVPGGRLCILAMAQRENPGVMVRLYEWSHRAFPGWVDCKPIDVEEAVKGAGLTMASRTTSSMYGLPIEIVLAVNQLG